MDTQYRSDDEIFTEIGVFDSLQLLRNLSDWQAFTSPHCGETGLGLRLVQFEGWHQW